MRRSWKSSLLIFFLLTLLVIFIQYDLLYPTLKVGLTPDDWSFIFYYKLLGSNPLSKIVEVWSVNGPYTTIPLYYTGFINSIVGFDFQKMQMVSILFKILATLVLFPLTLIFFRNRLLAVLTTIFFAMSYPSTGALETAVEPSEYLGTFSMGLFLITYYQVIKKNLQSWKWLVLTTFLLIITILLSVTRLYPLLILILLIEIYLLILKRSIMQLRISLSRLGILFLPFIIITFFRPTVILSYVGVLPTVLLKVLEGNWHLALTPLQGLGYTLPISVHLWKLFGLLNIDKFNDYISFIVGGPTIIFGSIILSLGFITSKKPWRFFLRTFCLNLILEILVFFIANHYQNLPIGQRINFDTPRIYSTLIGLFVLILSIVYWVEWKEGEEKSNLLLALWVGPAVSFLFTVLTWMLASVNLSFGGAQDHYLLIPEYGTSLFVSGILTLTYERIKVIRLRLLKALLIGMIFIVIATFYLLNRNLIHSYFNHANANGRAALGQQVTQSKFRERIKKIDLTKPALFYFDTSDLSGNGPFYTEGLLSPFPFFMHFQGNNLIDGCIEVFYEDRQKLSSLIKVINKEKGFIHKGLCVENGRGGYREIFYKPENFYAFKIKNEDFIDIKDEVLKELGF